MSNLTHHQRAEWTREIDGVRAELPDMSYDHLADMIEDAMRIAADESDHDPGLREALRTAHCSLQNVYTLCSFPANPLGTAEKRARVIGLCAVLGIDRSTMSRLGGGI